MFYPFKVVCSFQTTKHKISNLIKFSCLFFKKSKTHDFLLLKMFHKKYINDFSHIQILCMIENLIQFFLIYNKWFLV